MPTGVYKHKPLSEEHKKNIGRGNKGRVVSKKTRLKISKALMGRSAPPTAFKRGHRPASYKGKIKNSKGYIEIHKPEHPFANIVGRVLEHRLIIEKQTGKYLEPKEDTHHINKIRDDNRPENLMAFISRSAHRRFEMFPHYEGIDINEIIFDGSKL